MNESIVNLFKNLTDRVLVQIGEFSKAAVITNFEEKAFSSFCLAAQIAAETYLQSETLPYNKIKKVNDLDTIADAYIFLCAIELHTFLERINNSAEIKDILDTPTEKFIKDFAKCFGYDETHKYFHEMLNFFDKILADMRDPRDLWYNQAIMFGDKISEGQIDFGKLTENDLAAKTTISLITQSLRIESAKLFDRIVFDIDSNDAPDLINSTVREKRDKKKWLERALRKGKISQEFYESESKKVEEEINQAIFTEMQKKQKEISDEECPNPTMTMKNGHIVIKLVCPRCGTEGENTYGSVCFKILGKDRKGFLYFECPDCKEHLQYAPMTGRIRIRKGILGFLFGRFS